MPDPAAALTAPARTTEWCGYPLPPAPPRAETTFGRYNWYRLPHPETGIPTGYPRATTVAKVLDDTYNLSMWSRRETVKRVMQLMRMAPDTVVWGEGESHGEDITAAAMIALLDRVLDDDGVHATPAAGEGNDMLNRLDNIAGGAHARELGTCVHAWLEAIDLGQVLMRDVPDLVAEHVRAAHVVLAEAGLVAVPDYVERVVLNTRHGEAVVGTLDRIYRQVDTGALIMGDVKTSHGLDFSKLTFSVQVGGVYAGATHMLDIDGGGWQPMPGIDQQRAVILHVPSDNPALAGLHTVNIPWSREVLAESLSARARRAEARRTFDADDDALPPASDRARRYAQARLSLSYIDSHDDGQAVYTDHADVWDAGLDEHAAAVAALLE